MKVRCANIFLLFTFLLLNAAITEPACIADNAGAAVTITSPPSAPSYSKQLGVQASPMTVEITNVEQKGLYIMSDPNKPLGKAMKLKQNMLLVTLDGFAVTSVSSIDSYLQRRAAKKGLTFSYIPIMSGGAGDGVVHNGKCDMP